MKNITDLPDGMVLIKEVGGVKVFNNTGRWGETLSGFHIQQPLCGFVDELFWNNINIFQNINIKDDDVIRKMIRVGEKVTDEDMQKHTDIKKWNDLIKETNYFNNTIEEFMILTGINSDGVKEYERAYCELGKVNWGIVENF